MYIHFLPGAATCWSRSQTSPAVLRRWWRIGCRSQCGICTFRLTRWCKLNCLATTNLSCARLSSRLCGALDRDCACMKEMNSEMWQSANLLTGWWQHEVWVHKRIPMWFCLWPTITNYTVAHLTREGRASSTTRAWPSPTPSLCHTTLLLGGRHTNLKLVSSIMSMRRMSSNVIDKILNLLIPSYAQFLQARLNHG